MSDMPTPAQPHSKEAPKSTARVTMHGDMAKNMKVGEPAAMRMKGTVKSITPVYDHDSHYDVEIEGTHIEHINDAGEDENLATMPKEKLKKKISKSEY